MRRSVIALSGALALLVASVVLHPQPAKAYAHLCGKFMGSDPAISYRYYSVTDAYATAFGGAQSDWDSTSAPGYFSYQPTNDDPMINVHDGAYSWTHWAEMDPGSCVVGLWSYNEVTIRFNTREMAGLSAREKKIVAVHELGHAYGLAHTSLTCSSPGPSVMRQGTAKFSCAGTAPWADDVNGVRAKY